MQNRFVISDIPVSISCLPKAKDSLRDFVEERSCWVDRFAFLTCNSDNDGCCIVAIELHIENVRDKAIKVLDGLIVSMDQEGNINNNGCISFQLHARPASISESSQLVQLCPIESDDVEAESQMEKQTLKLQILGNDNINISIRKSIEHGGTGTFPWRGGLLLASQICHWAGEYTKRNETKDVESSIDYFGMLFCNKKILELGGGSSGLPSLLLGKIISSTNILDDYSNMNMNSLICSDGIDEIVQGLRMNVSDNELDECITVKHIDWNDYINCDEQRDTDMIVDTILFADCIYNAECAVALNQTIRSLLKVGGCVVGVLPDFRVGVDVFERSMKEWYTPIEIPIVNEKTDGFVCNGGRGKDYRLVLWRDKKST